VSAGDARRDPDIPVALSAFENRGAPASLDSRDGVPLAFEA
jgi:hypothetical protein